MSLWRELKRGLQVLANRREADREVADEVRHYLDEATAAGVAQGLSPQAARLAALREVGGVTAVREQVRDYGWENGVEIFLTDLRQALRRLMGKPQFTITCLATLAIGLGATVAIFSVIYGVLLKPLPYPQPEQIVGLVHTAPGINMAELNLSMSLYFTYREESRVFSDVGMSSSGTVSVTGLAEPEETPVFYLTPRYLATLGVRPLIGRDFAATDDDPRSERVVIVSDGYWRTRLGGDANVLARQLTIDGIPHRVIGVMPRAAFGYKDRPVSLLVPFRMRRGDVSLISFCCEGIARLKPGVTLEQANADVARMIAIAPQKFPVNAGFNASVWKDARIAPRLRELKDVVVGDVGKTLWVLMATVGLVLLIACANVANLLLVRADGRQQELAVRTALGAGWTRIARELLLESLLLGLAGGTLALALAYGGIRILAALKVAQLPRAQDISIDPVVILFTAGVSLVSALLFGLIPVWKYARPQVAQALRGGGRSASHSRERSRGRDVLVVVQVALALVLLVGSGLMIRTFQALRRVDPGFSDASQIETFRVSIPDTQAKDHESSMRMQEQILRQVQGIAGVTQAGMINVLPLAGGSSDPVFAEGVTPIDKVPPIRRNKFISPGYFAAAGARLLAGRDLTWNEIYQRIPVALVSENMARELWGSPSAAIGKRIRVRLKDDWREVIGVVADLRDHGIDQKAPTIVYWPLLLKNYQARSSYTMRTVGVVIRTPRAGSPGLLNDLQRAVASVNPNLPVADVRTLETWYNRSLARTSFTLVLLGITGAMALFLGLVGIFSVISYAVSQRTREIGIRLALGASLENVTRVFVRQGLVLAAVGAACGLAAAVVLTRGMTSILYEVSPTDPLTYLGVSAGLIGAATLASYLPARRATKVDPCEALRSE